MKKAHRNLIIFILIVVFSGWLGVIVDSVLPEQPNGDSLGMGIWLLLPMLTAIIIILTSKIPWKEIGFRPNFRGNMIWYLTSILIFPIVTAIILLIGRNTGWIDTSALNLKHFIGVFASTLIVGFIKNIFEETVWRGYLTSQLLKTNFNDWMIYLIAGLVWGVWHIPYYMVFLPKADMLVVLPVSRAIFSIVAIINMICWSVMFIELYRITKSIWPCVILHTVEDALINPLVISRYISIAAGKEIIVSPITGIVTSVLYLVVGLGLRKVGRKATI